MRNLKTIYLILLVIFLGCSEEDEKMPPSCNIVSPTTGTSIEFGNDFTVKVNASDPDGNIRAVDLYIGNKLIQTKNASPYNFDVNNNFDPGSYDVKAIAMDDDDLTEQSLIKLNILALAPIVNTVEIVSIESDKINIKGKVDSDGGSTVSERGFCWNTTGSPIINDNYITVGNDIGEYAGTINDLNPGTTYYLAAYAKNSKGVAYGATLTATTETTKPSIKTINIDAISSNSCAVSVELVSDGGAEINELGVCYSLNSNPSVNDNIILSDITNGQFNINIDELKPYTKYYVKAFAKNEKGISYGEELNFETLKGIPEVETTNINTITSNSFNAFGEVISDGGDNILQKGFCYSLDDSPTKDDNIIISDSNSTEFNATIEGLSPGTTYYIAAFAENSKGVSYGTTLTTTTDSTKPSVKTNDIKEITSNSGTISVELLSNGGAEILEIGVCYSLNSNPNVNDSVVFSEINSGEFNVNIEGLEPNMQYYVKAFAKNEKGLTYGEELNFVTLKEKPKVETLNIDSVTSSSFDAHGTITSDGGDNIIQKGFCYNLVGSPNKNDNITLSNSNSNEFTATIENLSPNTTYYVVAFAENSIGVSYGEEMVIKTDIALPQVNTGGISNLSYYSVSVFGNLTFNGGDENTKKGICWSTSSTPTISSYIKEDSGNTNNFSVSISNLTPNKKYFYRAYAENEKGVNYGEIKSFTTLQIPSPRWLYYDSGANVSTKVSSTNNTPKIVYVRFKKPTGWNRLKISKVKLGYFTSLTFANFEIMLSDKTQIQNNLRFPKDFSIIKNIEYVGDPHNGWKDFSISNKYISSEYFYVGVRLNSTLDPHFYYNSTASNSNNNTGLYLDNDNMAIIRDIELYLRVYVEFSNTSSKSSTKGQWISNDTNTIKKQVDIPSRSVNELKEIYGIKND